MKFIKEDYGNVPYLINYYHDNGVRSIGMYDKLEASNIFVSELDKGENVTLTDNISGQEITEEEARSFLDDIQEYEEDVGLLIATLQSKYEDMGEDEDIKETQEGLIFLLPNGTFELSDDIKGNTIFDSIEQAKAYFDELTDSRGMMPSTISYEDYIEDIFNFKDILKSSNPFSIIAKVFKDMGRDIEDYL